MSYAFLVIFLFMQAQATTPSTSPRVLALLDSGLEAEAHGNLDQAIVAFQKASALAPADPVAFFRLGEAYMKKNDYGSAIGPLKQALKLSPDAPPVHRLLGFALLSAGYASGAIPHLEKVHEYGALGIAELEAGQPAEAVKDLEAALAKDPNDPDLLFYLSRASSALSSRLSDRLLVEFSNSVRGHQVLGQNYFAVKMYPEAEKEYKLAIALRPGLPGLRLELGQIYAADSDWPNAESEFRAEVKLQPGSAEAAYRLGDALLQQGKMKEAVEELRRSDRLRPDMPPTLYSLGKAAAISDPALAESALERVIRMEKDTPLAGRAYLALAEVHRRQGRSAEAAADMQEYRRIQAIAPRFPQ
jgi:tetratricopeptide (TPR) repeat protein